MELTAKGIGGQLTLRDAGVISDEEFEAKKAELMARL